MGDSQEGNTKKNKTWSVEESNVLLQLLVDGAKRGLRDINGVISKQTVVDKLLPTLKSKLGYEVTFQQYQSRVKWFKKQYGNYAQLIKHNSGFGWDPETKKFTAPDEVWADYLKSHPTHRHLRTEAFVDYEDLKIAVGNGTATGMGSLSVGDDDTEATIFTAEEGLGGLDDLVFDRNTQVFVNASEATNVGVTTQNSTRGKRSRADFEKNAASNDYETLGSGIKAGIDKIFALMENRESKETKCWDALQEIPGLSNEDCFMAVDMINTKVKLDMFLRMTIEQRFEWIRYEQNKLCGNHH